MARTYPRGGMAGVFLASPRPSRKPHIARPWFTTSPLTTGDHATGVPGGDAAANRFVVMPAFVLRHQRVGWQLLPAEVAKVYSLVSWHPAGRLPTKRALASKPSRPCAPGEGRTQGLRGCAGKPKCWRLSCVSGVRQTTPSKRTAPSRSAVASGSLVRPMGSSVAKQLPCRGSRPSRWRALAQRAGADGFIVLPRQCQLQYRCGHVHDGAVSKQGHTQYQPKCLLHGSRRLRSVATPVICKALSIHCWGMLFQNDTPALFGASSKLMGMFRYSAAALAIA